MPKDEIIAEFPKCRVCGCEETLTQKAWKFVYPDDVSPPETGIPGMIIPLTKHSAAVNISLPAVPGMAVYTDFCGECGSPRATKALKTIIPADMLQQALAQAAQQAMNQPRQKIKR